MSGWLHIHHRAASDLWLPELLVPGLVSVSSLDLVTGAQWARDQLRGGGGLRVRGDKTVNTVTSLVRSKFGPTARTLCTELDVHRTFCTGC